jgi:hypothetical protein
MKKLRSRLISLNIIYYFLLALISVLAFWQVALFQYALKWDMIDYFLPSKYIIGEMMQHKVLPFWSPYQTLGYPIFADPQSGVAYPFTWLIGLLWGYNLNTLAFEFVLHICIAGCGMFALGKTLKFDKSVAFILAVSYMLCGLFVGNAQHLSWIIAGAWLPFVFNSFLQIQKEKTVLNALKLALFGFLFLNGYPAIVFILFYFLLILQIWFLYQEKKENGWVGLRKLLSVLSLSVVFLLITSSLILTGYYYVMPYLSRASGVSPDLMNALPFSTRCLISLVSPFSTIQADSCDIYGTDLSMSNGYFGFIVLLFALIAIFSRKGTQFWLFVLFAIFSLLVSFGSETPLREFLYYHVPFMNLFKYPSVFRIFFIFFMILLAGVGLQKFNEEKLNKKAFLGFVIFLMGLIFAIVLYLNATQDVNIKAVFRNDFIQYNKTLIIAQQFIFQGVILFVLLGAFCLILIRKINNAPKIKWLTFLIVTEIVISAQVCSSGTVFESNARNEVSNQFFDKIPKGFPLPAQKSVITTESTAFKEGTFWRNLSTFNKQISSDGFTPFTFHSSDYWYDTVPVPFNAMLKNYPAYISNSVFPEDSMIAHQKRAYSDSAVVYLTAKDYVRLKDKLDHRQNAGKYNFVKFFPNGFILQNTMENPGILALLQNEFKGWKVFVDGREVQILTINKGIMGVFLEKGSHKVVFKYKPLPVVVSLYITVISFFSLLTAIIVLTIKRNL